MLTSGSYPSHLDRLPSGQLGALRHSSVTAMPQIAEDAFEMTGNSTAIARLRLQVRRVGPHFRIVLLSGEPGSGKERTARALHRFSQGANGPFVVCRAAEMDEPEIIDPGRSNRMQVADRMQSWVEEACSGTLFVDRIDKMPLAVQAQLVRIMRRQDWTHKGLAAPRQKVDLRLIASTQDDLKVLASAGRFSQELYRQLSMVEIALPTLRERIDDIPELTTNFLAQLSGSIGQGIGSISRDATEKLKTFYWPGNVREMQQVLRDAASRCQATILEAHHLPPLVETFDDEAATEVLDGPARLQDVVEQHMLQVLKSCGGNKLRAAELLGISRSTLYRMLDACSSAEE
jgi:DNA-binding NtrC family response regulator